MHWIMFCKKESEQQIRDRKITDKPIGYVSFSIVITAKLGEANLESRLFDL